MAAKYPDDVENANMADKLGLACAICLEPFTDPKCLPCVHSFCTDCLEEYAAKVSKDIQIQGVIDCPTCREQFHLPTDISTNDWIKNLPSNYALQVDVNYVSGKQTIESKKDQLCGPCRKSKKHVVSTMFCKDCKDFICEECTNIHKRFTHLEDHKMVKFEELTSEELLMLEIDQLENCTEDNKPLKFYCSQHSTLLCSECSFPEHMKCDNVIRLDKTDSKDNELKGDNLKILYLSLQSKHQHSIRFLEENEKNVTSQVSALEDKLKNTRRKMIDRWDAFESAILREAEQVKQETVDKCRKNRAGIEQQFSALNGTVRTLDVVMKRGTQSQVFISLHKLEEQFATYQHNSQELLTDLKSVKVELQLGEHIKGILDEDIQIGALLNNTTHHTVESLLNYKPVQLELKIAKDLKAGQDGNKEKPLLAGLEYLSDGRLVVVDNNNMNCILMDGDLNLLESYQFDNYPFCIVSNTDNTVMVTRTGKQLTQLSINPDNTFSHISTTNTTSYVFSISSMDDDNFMVGCYNEDKPVHVVSRSGVVTDLELDLPEGKFGPGETRCCYRKELNQLVLTVRHQDTVYIYNMTHKQRVVVRHEDIKTPLGVAIDRTGCSFVCCNNTHCVVQISPVGEVIGTFKLDSMEYPRCIAISSNNQKLVVSNALNNARKLHEYKLS